MNLMKEGAKYFRKGLGFGMQTEFLAFVGIGVVFSKSFTLK